MDRNILRIDLDVKTYKEALYIITDRLSYFHDINFLKVDIIDCIEFIYKTNFSCRIKLNHRFSPMWIVMLQTLLGSDYRKEVNTLINHFKYNMKYSNRLFTVKRYKDGDIKFAQILDVTDCIVPHIKSKKRLKNAN